MVAVIFVVIVTRVIQRSAPAAAAAAIAVAIYEIRVILVKAIAFSAQGKLSKLSREY